MADVIVHVTGDQAWRTVAFYSIGGGVVGAPLAAVPGLIDLFSMGPGTTRRIGIWHMSLNLVAVAVFAVNFVMRWQTGDHSGRLLLSALGVVIIAVSGWLGGEMVYVGGAGVAPAARGAGPAPAP